MFHCQSTAQRRSQLVVLDDLVEMRNNGRMDVVEEKMLVDDTTGQIGLVVQSDGVPIGNAQPQHGGQKDVANLHVTVWRAIPLQDNATQRDAQSCVREKRTSHVLLWSLRVHHEERQVGYFRGWSISRERG